MEGVFFFMSGAGPGFWSRSRRGSNHLWGPKKERAATTRSTPRPANPSVRDVYLVYYPVGRVILWPIFVIFPRSRKKRNPGEVLRVPQYTLPVANLPPGYYTRFGQETL